MKIFRQYFKILRYVSSNVARDEVATSCQCNAFKLAPRTDPASHKPSLGIIMEKWLRMANETMHNSQYVTRCNPVHNKTLQLQNCYNRLSNRMTYLLKYYVSAFTNTKTDHTLPIRYNNFTRWDAVLRHAQDIV